MFRITVIDINEATAKTTTKMGLLKLLPSLFIELGLHIIMHVIQTKQLLFLLLVILCVCKVDTDFNEDCLSILNYILI